MSEESINDNRCFCCGKDNPQGLGMKFDYPEEGTAISTLSVPEWFTGWREITHGGFIATVLDEIMAHACISLGKHGFTAELTVRFRDPLKVGSEIKVEGKVTKNRGRIMETEAEIIQGDTIIASAKARFITA